MKWFGVKSGGDPADQIPVPVGEPCVWCDELVAERDSGVTMPLVAADRVDVAVYHLECFMRTVVGSVGHQLKLCACYGGGEDCEPPEQSRREQARAAWTLYLEQHRADGDAIP